jgi:hypothetical protein
MVEGFITSAVIMAIFLFAMGIEAFVAFVPALVMFSTGMAGIAIGISMIYYGKVAKKDESSHKKDTD